LEFASALPARYGFVPEAMSEKEYGMFDYVG
jgi:hypothetical protein